ncbi:Transposase [Bifidobacterium longum subsp. longum]|uniref:Transposase n=1 Tax=Bifidobacterium longum subsp. longum TaxID=1679 RepID=A0A4R0UND7_BIFLL|nr:Transposase [Bifidobacterium longum subsp. longum]
MPITSPGNDDDTGENHQPTLRKNTAEPVEQTLKQNTNENGSYRPYRPKRLKTGPWTSGPFYSALAAQRKADLRRRGSRKPRRMDSDRLRA